ncbi:hypothetical protein LJC59_10005, partial [Desulfovibrio sp. OttesenSCG-928-A18]|nr:hypothetical protein [Desulfovibrio sp. OttesenSCG-928-A18]
ASSGLNEQEDPMDIWGWVEKLTEELEESGQDRVASLFYRIVDLICDNEIAQVEALLPEALAAAKAMENPWAEVFFRHQEMRLRLGLRGEGESALPSVVDLLEFAHSDACEGCPQAVCTTQDISSCYANMDALGWAEERKAVCMEGMNKIDPSWACFNCLSIEYSDALADQGKHEEALAFYEDSLKKRKEHGDEEYVYDYHVRVDRLIRMRRFADALAVLDQADAMDGNKYRADLRMDSSLLRSRVLAELGRYEEAWDILPNWSEIIPGDYRRWLDAASLVAMAVPEHNSWGLGSAFQQALEQFSAVGAHRRIMQTGEQAVRLAIARGSVSSPRRALAIMRRHLDKLREPLGADLLIEELERAAAAVPALALPVAADKLVEHIRESDHSNAEEGLDWLFTAMEELPDDSELLFMTCSALSAMRAGEEVRELLWSYIRRNPLESEKAVDEFIRYTPHDKPEELEALAVYIEDHLPHMADWSRLYIAYRANNLEDVAEHAARFLEKMPEKIGARLIWANAAMANKDFATAARLRAEVVELEAGREGGDPNYYRWDLLVSATCMRDWKLVRDTCIAMDFDVEPGDEPIDDPGQYVRIRYQEDGDWHTAYARRNGPVTARITTCNWPRQIQRLNDWVVFDPAPLESEPENEEERQHFCTPYYLEHILEKGNCVSYFADGFFPGDEEWKRFAEALEGRGVVVDIRSNDDYSIVDPDAPEEEETAGTAASAPEAPERERDAAGGDEGAEGDEGDEGDEGSGIPAGRLPGIYFLLGVPASFSPTELDAILSEETKAWAHPLAWAALAEAAGKPVERHKAIMEKYDL